jgi:glycosyltransferase involved in cell wall biosynthesis
MKFMNKHKQKKTIGIVVRGLTRGGVRRFVENILLEIEKANSSKYEFHLIHNETAFKHKFKNIKNHYIATKNKFLFDYFFSFNLVRKSKFDVLIYQKNVIPLSHFLCKGKKSNIVHDLGYFESSIEAYPFLDTLFMKTFMKISCKFSNRIFAISQATRKDIVDRFKINPAKITVIHAGIEDTFRIIENKKRLKGTLKKYDLNKRFLFYAGSISPRKNLMRVLKAFNEIKGEISHDLIITGNQVWGKDNLEDYVKQNLEGRVRKLGHVSEKELVDLYNLADVYIFPSLYEGFGLPILEAQKCGCPVLASNVTSCPEVAGDAAIIVDPYSVDDIKEGMLQLIKDEKIRKDLVERGFINVKRYSWEKTTKLILEKINF